MYLLYKVVIGTRLIVIHIDYSYALLSLQLLRECMVQ